MEKEAAHENKLTYRHFEKIVKKKGKKTIIEEPGEKPMNIIGRQYPRTLGASCVVFFRKRTGQTNAGCNSAIKSTFGRMQELKFKTNGKGIVLYLPLGKTLRNTNTKTKKEAIAFIESYIERILEVGIFFGIKFLGEVENPSPVSCDEDRVEELVNKINPIRSDRVKESVIFGINKTYFPTAVKEDVDTSLEKEWLGVSIDFRKDIVSGPHALAQATVIRYLFYNRYNGIAAAFMKICDKLPEITKIQALSLAHYWCHQRPYSSYYGLQPEQKLMSFADNPADVMTLFALKKVINISYAKYQAGHVVKKTDPWGNSYDSVSTTAGIHWEKHMMPLVDKNDYKGAFECINKWVNG